MAEQPTVRKRLESVEAALRLERALGVDAWPRTSTVSHLSPADATPHQRLAILELEARKCERCPLHRTRTKLVFGDGSASARLVLVGEAPGRDEDLQGRPFVGAAGQLLTKILEAIGLRRDQVYICNILKDRPPGNRTPLPEEISACRGWVEEQLRIIHPEVICTLGAVAGHTLLNTSTPITQLRGTWHAWEQIALMPTLHPAYLLRNPDAKRLVWEDMKQIRARLARPTAKHR